MACQSSYQNVKLPETGKVFGKLAYLKGQLISEEFFLSSDTQKTKNTHEIFTKVVKTKNKSTR